MKTSRSRLLSAAAIVLGLLLCFAPLMLSALSDFSSQQILCTREVQVAGMDEQQKQDALEKARQWNRMLYGEPDETEYNSQLNLFDDGVMGILHIPSISLALPIYHGCSAQILSKGAGHLPSSALPAGSDSARCVLSAHRGLADAPLFTRIDELKEGDLFWIDNSIELLAYEVSDIRVIDPSDFRALDPIPGEDLVTLMTCTPYGMNTHRLLVTGKRVSMPPEEQTQAQPLAKIPRKSGLLIVLVPIFLGVWTAGTLLCGRKRKKRREILK